MSIIESIQNKLDQNEYATGVFVDLRKAFDTVDILEYYGFKRLKRE